MAAKPDYEVGTVSLGADDTALVGVDTLWVAADIQPGDTFKVRNLDAVILAVNSNTSITLAEPWTGGALAAGSTYRIRYQPDGSRYAAMLGFVRALLTGGNVSAFQALEGAADKIAYFTGAGTMALADFKAWARSFFALTPAADKLAYFSTTTAMSLVDFKAWARSLLGLTPAANKAIYFSDGNTAALYDLTEAGRSIAAMAGAATEYVRADGTKATLNKAAVGLGNVDNTSDANKPVSNATQTALDLKANTASPTLTGTTTAIALRVGQGTVPGKIGLSNNNGVYIGEIGVTTGTGDTGKVGFYNSVNGGWWFNGAVQVTGALSKASGTFLIDHPLDPANRNLRHGFVEAPRYDLIYRGTAELVAGRARVDIDAASDMTDGTFAALTVNACVTSLQNQDGFARMRPGAISRGEFEIICEDETCSDVVSWVVIAERADAFVRLMDDNCERGTGRFIPEFDKED